MVWHVGGASERDASAYAKWTRKQEGLHRFFEQHYAKEAVRRIAQRDLRQARLRCATLGLKAGVGLASEHDRAKAERYRAIRDTSRALLERQR